MWRGGGGCGLWGGERHLSDGRGGVRVEVCVCGCVGVGVGWGETLIRRTGWGAGGGVCVGVWRWVWGGERHSSEGRGGVRVEGGVWVCGGGCGGGVGETFVRPSENERDCVAVSNGPFENRSISGLIADDVRKLFTCVARIVGAIWTFRLSKLKK